MIMSFKVLKYFLVAKEVFSICLRVLTRSQTGKNVVFFSEILAHTTVGFFHKKKDGLWPEFALFKSDHISHASIIPTF